MIDRDNFRGSVRFMASAFPLISEHAVLADGLDGFLLAVDVVPPGLLQVPAVVRHKLHLHAVLKRKMVSNPKLVIQRPTWFSFLWFGMMLVSEMWIQLLYLPSTSQQ